MSTGWPGKVLGNLEPGKYSNLSDPWDWRQLVHLVNPRHSLNLAQPPICPLLLSETYSMCLLCLSLLASPAAPSVILEGPGAGMATDSVQT